MISCTFIVDTTLTIKNEGDEWVILKRTNNFGSFAIYPFIPNDTLFPGKSKVYNITTTDTRIYESGFRLVESQEYINFMNLLLDKNKIMETEFAKTHMENILHIPYDNDLHFDIDFIIDK